MTSDNENTLTLEGNLYEFFSATALKIGVSENTLTMMAISQFLNSPLVNSYFESDHPLRKTEKFLLHGEELESAEMSALEEIKGDTGVTLSLDDVFGMIKISEDSFEDFGALAVSFEYDDTILWGQFSRFLPIKFSLRILANLSEKRDDGVSSVTIGDWFESTKAASRIMREYLRDLDVKHRNPRGEQLASGFPRWSGDPEREEKSVSRYVNHFCATQYNDGTIVGFPAHLGLIIAEGNSSSDFMDWKVALTEDGLNYVKLKNPVIDEEAPTLSMSNEEAEFMIRRIREGLPSSWGFLKFVLGTILDGADTPTELSDAITINYGEGTTRNWNDKQVPTYRTGAIGLLGDLGLISRTWSFRRVIYEVTDLGMEVYASGD